MITFCAKYVITAESIVQWIQWLDKQEGPRGEAYRAGIAAGQAMVQERLNANGQELDPMDSDKYMKSVGIVLYHHLSAFVNYFKVHATVTGAQANLGVRLVDSENGVDDGVHAVAGGLESMIIGNNSTMSSNLTPSLIYHTARHTRGSATPTTPTTPTPEATSRSQLRNFDSHDRHQGPTSIPFFQS